MTQTPQPSELPYWLNYVRAIGPLISSALAVLVSFLVLRLNRSIASWQVTATSEQLRQNLYDRRFAVYKSFRDLILGISKQDNNDTLLRAANNARTNSPFLLGDDMASYLQGLYKSAFRLNAATILIRNKTITFSPEQINKLDSDRLAFVEQIEELIERFKPYLQVQTLPKVAFNARMMSALKSIAVLEIPELKTVRAGLWLSSGVCWGVAAFVAHQNIHLNPDAWNGAAAAAAGIAGLLEFLIDARENPLSFSKTRQILVLLLVCAIVVGASSSIGWALRR